MRGAFAIVTVALYVYEVYGNTVLGNNPTSDESLRDGMAAATIPPRMATRQPILESRTASTRTITLGKPARLNGRALTPINNPEIFTPPRTQLPMIVGFPVFRTRILAPETLPPRIAETITTSTTTAKSKNEQDVAVTAIIPTTLTIPTTTIKRTTSPTMGTIMTTTTEPRTEPMVIGFPVFRTRFLIPSTPPEPPVTIKIVAPLTSSTRVTANTVISLCGYPPYNDPMACIRLDYFSEPISTCEHEWGRILFSVLVGIVATAIISVNGLIIVIILKNPDMRTHYDSIKVSLAIADAIIGFLLFVTVLPNSIWIRGLSEADIVDAIIDDVNSPAAIVIGSLLSLTMQASMLHLCFLSIERFLSIKISFWLLRRKTSSITITLTAIWIISLVSAFLPAAFPQHFEYKFQPAVLIHMLTLKPKAGTFTQVGYEGLIYVMITMVLPYIVMVSFCISTGVVSYGKLTSSKKYFGKGRSKSSAESSNMHSKSISGSFSPARGKNKRNLKPEISVFITILIMINAFTVTLSKC